MCNFNFYNGVSELQMKLPSFLGYFNTFGFTVLTLENEVKQWSLLSALIIYCCCLQRPAS